MPSRPWLLGRRKPLFDRQKWLPTIASGIVAGVVLGGLGLDRPCRPSAGTSNRPIRDHHRRAGWSGAKPARQRRGVDLQKSDATLSPRPCSYGGSPSGAVGSGGGATAGCSRYLFGTETRALRRARRRDGHFLRDRLGAVGRVRSTANRLPGRRRRAILFEVIAPRHLDPVADDVLTMVSASRWASERSVAPTAPAPASDAPRWASRPRSSSCTSQLLAVRRAARHRRYLFVDEQS